MSQVFLSGRRITLPTKVRIIKPMFVCLFPNSHIQMWELDNKKGWVLKNWCLQTVVLEKAHDSPLDWKEIKSISPKRNQPWIFIGRAGAETEAPILWPSDVESQLIGKDPDAGKDWGKEKGVTEDKMVGWHHRFKGHEFEQTPGAGEGQGSLACCRPRGRKEPDTTERLNSSKPRHKLAAVKWAVVAAGREAVGRQTCRSSYNLHIWLCLSLKRSITVSFYHEILLSH